MCTDISLGWPLKKPTRREGDRYNLANGILSPVSLDIVTGRVFDPRGVRDLLSLEAVEAFRTFWKQWKVLENSGMFYNDPSRNYLSGDENQHRVSRAVGRRVTGCPEREAARDRGRTSRKELVSLMSRKRWAVIIAPRSN